MSDDAGKTRNTLWFLVWREKHDLGLGVIGYQSRDSLMLTHPPLWQPRCTPLHFCIFCIFAAPPSAHPSPNGLVRRPHRPRPSRQPKLQVLPTSIIKSLRRIHWKDGIRLGKQRGAMLPLVHRGEEIPGGDHGIHERRAQVFPKVCS